MFNVAYLKNLKFYFCLLHNIFIETQYFEIPIQEVNPTLKKPCLLKEHQMLQFVYTCNLICCFVHNT